MARFRGFRATNTQHMPPHMQRYFEAVQLQHKTPFKLKPHHAKPYRLRHVAALGVSLIAVIIACASVIWYVRDSAVRRTAANAAVLEQSVRGDILSKKPILLRSTVGFSFSINPQVVSISARTDPAQTNSMYYDSSQVSEARAYREVVLTYNGGAGSAIYGSSMVVSADPDHTVADNQVSARQAQATTLAAQVPAGYRAEQVSHEQVTYDNVTFEEVILKQQPTTAARGGVVFAPQRVTIYSAVMPNGVPLAVRIAVPEDSPIDVKEAYENIMRTFSAHVTAAKAVGEVSSSSRTFAKNRDVPAWLRQLGIAPMVAHAAQPTILDEAVLVARNAPAVVKLYHIACGNVTYKSQDVTPSGCRATTGSGFFVSSDGYIATNGHVVSSSAKETVINDMSVELLSKILTIDGYKTTEINTIVGRLTGDSQAKNTIAEAIYRLPDDALKFENQQDLYIVALGEDAPDITTLASNPSLFKESIGLKQAELKAINYAPGDLYDEQGFTHSDVALLKVDGGDYPIVHLGSLTDIVPGAGVMVIGYPNDAEANPLIRGGAVQSTATRGIVSAIRQVNGSASKVVQSDVNIGHGNSGGPAFDESGNVFGVATYILSSNDAGGAGITYLRDIQDIKNLATAQSITLNTNSKTQDLWESGLRDFYSAHYAQAIKKFTTVNRLYPAHISAGQYITIAHNKIARGEQARSAWVPALIIVGLLASLAGVVLAAILIIRHRAHHHVYRAVQAGYLHGPFEHFQTIKRHQHIAPRASR